MNFHRYNVLESTNLHLINMAKKNAPAWTIVLADAQTGGMGRSGRSWWSPPGGLYMSVLVRPTVQPFALSRMPVLASLAALDVLKGAGLPARVKWPNDILIRGKKLAGILIQGRTDGENVHWVVVGYGVNIHRSNTGTPHEIGERIIFLEDTHIQVTRDWLAETIAARLRDRIVSLGEDTWERAMKEWTQSAFWNAPYIHRDGRGEIRGTPLRLARDGGLVLGTDGGEVTVYSGEIMETVQSPGFKVQSRQP